jgi:hypothetical protein
VIKNADTFSLNSITTISLTYATDSINSSVYRIFAEHANGKPAFLGKSGTQVQHQEFGLYDVFIGYNAPEFGVIVFRILFKVSAF